KRGGGAREEVRTSLVLHLSWPQSLPRPVAHRRVTAQAIVADVGRGAPVNDLMNDVGVALDAVLLHVSGAPRFDADRLREVLQCEPLRVPEAVLRLCQVLASKIVWDVAVVADGDGMVARLLPAVVMLAHDVAVDARLRVVAEVREALGVAEQVRP